MKVGYSKSERRTYEHRAPQDVLDRLAALLSEIAAAGRQFVTDSHTPFLPPRFDSCRIHRFPQKGTH